MDGFGLYETFFVKYFLGTYEWELAFEWWYDYGLLRCVDGKAFLRSSLFSFWTFKDENEGIRLSYFLFADP